MSIFFHLPPLLPHLQLFSLVFLLPSPPSQVLGIFSLFFFPFWLHWVFVALWGLSLVAVSWLISSGSAWGPHFSHFSLLGSTFSWHTGSVVAAQGLRCP